MSEKLAAIIRKHVPPAAVEYCLQLWHQYPFEFKLRGTRHTKVGDFIWKNGKPPQITVNEELHPYFFLITLVHEVAHLEVHHHHGNCVDAHGTEWKDSFSRLLSPMMNTNVFPPELLKALDKHMSNPKASTFSDTSLTEVLRSYDPDWSRSTLLSELPEGSVFGLRGRWFKKGKLQRTRFLCFEVRTRRQFLVPADLPVEGAQLSLL